MMEGVLRSISDESSQKLALGNCVRTMNCTSSSIGEDGEARTLP